MEQWTTEELIEAKNEWKTLAEEQAKEIKELKEKIRHYEMMYHNTGAMFNRMTMKGKIKRYEEALKYIAGESRVYAGTLEEAKESALIALDDEATEHQP